MYGFRLAQAGILTLGSVFFTSFLRSGLAGKDGLPVVVPYGLPGVLVAGAGFEPTLCRVMSPVPYLVRRPRIDRLSPA